MKGDFSRNTFDHSKHYSSVRRQQGRVDVDADWNEQADIELYRRRTTSTDVIGASGGPDGVDADGNALAGFALAGADSDPDISPGRYYVDGILVENEAATSLRTQPDLAQADGAGNAHYGLDGAGTYVAYLDVWERHETHVDDDAMREVALNGPDTASRTRVVWQVKLQKVAAGGDPLPCAGLVPGWTPPREARTPGTLAARAEPDPAAQGPCVVPAGAGYRGLENQLYRVEVHAGGNGNTATFKWSRENGTILTRCDTWNPASKTLVVLPAPHAAPRGFAAGDWVELIADAAELRGEPGLLVELADAEGDRLKLTADPGLDPTGLKVRRWEVREGGADATFVKADGNATGGWIELEDGVQAKVETGDYHTGDYWLIPARTATGDVEWPLDGTTPRVLPPEGIVHHFAPLAVVTWNGAAFGSDVDDRRRLFPPLTAMARCACCTVTVGTGVTSCGDFNDLIAAIEWARAWQAHHGGVPVTICLLSGVHSLAATAVLKGDHDLTIHGCGPGTRVEGPANAWAFSVAKCTDVRIEAFTLDLTTAGDGINVQASTRFSLCHLDVVQVKEARAGVRVEGSHDTEVAHTSLILDDASDYGVAVVAADSATPAEAVRLVGVTVVGARQAVLLDGCGNVAMADCALSGGPEDGDGLLVGDAKGVRVADCTVNRIHAKGALRITAKAQDVAVTGCAVEGAVKGQNGSPALVVTGAKRVTVHDGSLSGVPAATLQGRAIALSENWVTGSGLQIGQGSEAVTVHGNEIGPGIGPGVVLGGAPVDPEAAKRAVGVVGVEVRDNRITGMTGSGIRTDPALTKNLEWGEVEGVTLAGNRIEGCAAAPKGEPAPAGVALEAAVDLTVSGNVVRDNRRKDGGPVFGILVNGCENLAVTDNRVADNGAERASEAVAGGWQAGIAALNVTGNGEGGPAAVIHGNTVSCPWGQALLVFGGDGVSVADNHLHGGGRPLTKTGLADRSVTLLQAGQCVLILNVNPGLLHALAMAGTALTHYHRGGVAKPRAMPGEAVLFHGNQLSQEVVGSDVPGIASMVVGTGDVAVADNSFLCTRVEGVAADVIALGASLRARGNRLAEPPLSLWLSALTYGVLGNITADNQAEHCILAWGGNVVNRDNQMFVYDCSVDKRLIRAIRTGGG